MRIANLKGFHSASVASSSMRETSMKEVRYILRKCFECAFRRCDYIIIDIIILIYVFLL